MFFTPMVNGFHRGYTRDRVRAVFLFLELPSQLHAGAGRKTLLAGWRDSLRGLKGVERDWDADLSSIYRFVARSRNCTSAARSCSEPMRCSGILVPGVKAEGPISNSLETVSGVQTISRRLRASEKL